MKVKHYQHYLYKTSIFAIYICIQTQRTKGNLVIVVVNVRNLNYLSVSPSILPIVALEALQSGVHRNLVKSAAALYISFTLHIFRIQIQVHGQTISDTFLFVMFRKDNIFDRWCLSNCNIHQPSPILLGSRFAIILFYHFVSQVSQGPVSKCTKCREGLLFH